MILAGLATIKNTPTQDPYTDYFSRQSTSYESPNSQIYLEIDSEEQAAEKNMLQSIYIICDRQARNVFIHQSGAVSQ